MKLKCRGIGCKKTLKIEEKDIRDYFGRKLRKVISEMHTKEWILIDVRDNFKKETSGYDFCSYKCLISLYKEYHRILEKFPETKALEKITSI